MYKVFTVALAACSCAQAFVLPRAASQPMVLRESAAAEDVAEDVRLVISDVPGKMDLDEMTLAKQTSDLDALSASPAPAPNRAPEPRGPRPRPARNPARLRPRLGATRPAPPQALAGNAKRTSASGRSRGSRASPSRPRSSTAGRPCSSSSSVC